MTRQKHENEGFEAHVSVAELTEGELEKATGGSGRVQLSDMQCQKYLDKASIIL